MYNNLHTLPQKDTFLHSSVFANNKIILYNESCVGNPFPKSLILMLIFSPAENIIYFTGFNKDNQFLLLF